MGINEKYRIERNFLMSNFKIDFYKIKKGTFIQGRVIYALMLREIATRHGTTQLGYAWEIIFPIALIFLKTFLFSTMGRVPPLGESFFLFFVTGLMPFFYWQHIVKQVQNGVISNKNLLIYPQVLPIDIFLARAILESLTTILVSFIILTFSYFYGVDFSIRSICEIFLLLLIYFIFSFGYGLISAGLIDFIPSMSKVFSLLSFPLFLLSGIMFTAESIPPNIREWLIWLPMLQYNEWMRSIFYVGFESPYYNISYLCLISSIFLFLGLILMKNAEYKER